PRKYAEAHADKADVAIAMANLSLERLLLQQRLERFADSVAELWPKLSPPRKVPPKVSKLAGYVEGVAKLRSDAAAGYRDATRLYDTAIRSADRIHE
ncbi:MAG: hypothetical protein KAX78_10890, partial [Phycisphaerae bacterium]|nr:hypothetical protein [Phycisphaerae bacterium]